MPGFSVLWGATLCGQIGVGMQQVLLGWLMLALTDSSSMVGLLFAVRSAPNLLVGFAAGAITDRLDRRLLLRLTGCGMALESWSLAWLWWSDGLAVWPLLCCTALLGVLQAFEATARQAYTFDVVGLGGAVQGLSLLAVAQRLGGVLGALLAGGTLQWWGVGVAFLVMGVSYAVGAGVLWTLKQRGGAAPLLRESLWHNVVAYGRELRNNRVMQSLMLSTAGAELWGFSHQALLPVLARDVLQSDAAGLGLLTAARFLGGVLGSGALTIWGTGRRGGLLLLLLLALFGGSQVLLAQASQFWFALGCVMGINVLAAATDILHMALLQQSVPNEQRGRAMGAWVVGLGAAPFGHLQIGYLASLVGVPLALCFNGVGLVILAGILALCLPRLRRL